jgi:uncharacterized protein YkwD
MLRHRRIALFVALAGLLALPARGAADLAVPRVSVPGVSDLIGVVPVPTSCRGAGAQPRRLGAAAARGALLCAVNRVRARHGLAAFGADAGLQRAAGRHAHDMVRRRYFAHQRAGGPSLADRLHAAGWRGRTAGEAIAWGCGSPASARATVRAWLHSPPHRAILLSSGFTAAGVGVAGRAPVSCGPGATWVLDTAG